MNEFSLGSTLVIYDDEFDSSDAMSVSLMATVLIHIDYFNLYNCVHCLALCSMSVVAIT